MVLSAAHIVYSWMTAWFWRINLNGCGWKRSWHNLCCSSDIFLAEQKRNTIFSQINRCPHRYSNRESRKYSEILPFVPTITSSNGLWFMGYLMALLPLQNLYTVEWFVILNNAFELSYFMLWWIFLELLIPKVNICEFKSLRWLIWQAFLRDFSVMWMFAGYLEIDYERFSQLFFYFIIPISLLGYYVTAPFETAF
jgi:hypothetical protein